MALHKKVTKISPIFTLLLFVQLNVNQILAQLQIQDYQPVETRAFFGFGVSINDYGIGLGIEAPLNDKLYFFGNAGIGGWGGKLGCGLTIYPRREPFGSAFSFGYSHAFGMNDFEVEMEVEPDDDEVNVVMDLNDAGTINFVYSYHWRLGQNWKFALSAGYAFPVVDEAYTIKTPGVELNEESKMFMDLMQPGGLIVGIKFMLGL